MSANKSKFTQTNLKEDKLKILQTYFPESILVTEDENGNKSYEIDSLKLQSFFNNGESVLVNTPDTPKDGYELSWVGKKFAYQDAFQTGEKVLKLEKNQSKNIDNTDNLVLIGDNIDVLKLLRQNYHNSIKCIYIDPPYNTGNDEFTYKDRFKETDDDICEQLGYDDKYKDLIKNMYSTSTHSAWMSFMLSRLLLAKELLKDDGVIFISIDDNEQAQLKLLCDEVFGESNFITNFLWLHGKGKKDKQIRTMQQYTLCYAKNKSNLMKWVDFSTITGKLQNPDNDERGSWFSGSMSFDESRSNKQHRNFFTINSPSGKEWTRQWQHSKDDVDFFLKNNLIYFGLFPKFDNVPRLKFFETDLSEIIPSNLLDNLGTTKSAQDDLNKLFDNKVFDYPKPYQLIKYLLNLLVDSNDTILDFFAGSGTTGDAVMQLNAEDGGNRKFILVQLDAPLDPKKSEVAHKFCADNNLDPVISSITIERLNRAGDKILEKNLSEKPELKDSLDIGYKVFSIHDDPESKFLNSDISEYRQEELFTEYSKLKNDPEFYTKENLIYNAYIYNNIPLSVTYKTLKDAILYQAENHYFCFGEISRDELEKHLNKHTEGGFTVFCGDGYVTDSFIHTCEAHLMQIAPNITYKVHG